MFVILLIILLAFIIFLIKIRSINSFFESYRFAKRIQGPPLWPLLGSLQFVGLDAVQVNALHEKYAKIYTKGFRIWAYGKLIYVTYTADAVEAIITNPKHIQKSFTYEFLHSFLGEGLLVSYGQKWFQRRKILTPAFHFTMLRKFHPSMKHHSEILVDYLKNEEKKSKNGTNVQEVISRFTLNTICDTSMGVAVHESTALDKYRAQIHEYGKVLVERCITPWAHLNILYKIFGKWNKEYQILKKVHKFTGDVIASRRTSRRDVDCYEDTFVKSRHAMLDTLLIAENDGLIDSFGIQEEVDTFIFEGYDTTMTAITFTLFMIAHHSEVQERLYNEIIAINDTKNDDINNFHEMKYLECVIKESLRLYPPVPLIGRRLGEEISINGIQLPTGTNVHILTNVLHRDPNQFPDPNKFDPGRFELQNSQNRHPFSYIPFSGSHRNCIGQKFAMLELKMVISKILLNFYLQPVTLIEDVIIKCDMVLRTQESIRIKFISRDQK